MCAGTITVDGMSEESPPAEGRRGESGGRGRGRTDIAGSEWVLRVAPNLLYQDPRGWHDRNSVRTLDESECQAQGMLGPIPSGDAVPLSHLPHRGSPFEFALPGVPGVHPGQNGSCKSHNAFLLELYHPEDQP